MWYVEEKEQKGEEEEAGRGAGVGFGDCPEMICEIIRPALKFTPLYGLN